MPASCVDAGPWICLEPGCPRAVVDCSFLSKVCSRTFGQIWNHPPPEVPSPRTPIWEACAITCTDCDICQRDDSLCEPELAWMMLRREAMSGSEAKGLRTMDATDALHYVFLQQSPPRTTYAEGFDPVVVGGGVGGADNSEATDRRKYSMRDMEACVTERCAAPLRACAGSEPCRDGWTDVAELATNVLELARLQPARIERRDVRALFECVASKCLCMAGLSGGDARPQVVRIPNALTDADATAILALNATLATNSSLVAHRSFGRLEPHVKRRAGHRCTYMQSRFETDPLTSALYEKIVRAVVAADADSGWRRLHAPTVAARTIELLDYVGTNDTDWSLGWHCDQQSAVTALLMLSTSADYDGGELHHMVAGEVTSRRPERLEMLVYRSHLLHAVSAPRTGRRLALALEFWHVPWRRDNRRGDVHNNPEREVRRAQKLRGSHAPRLMDLSCPL